jgi:hypothetical protein
MVHWKVARANTSVGVSPDLSYCDYTCALMEGGLASSPFNRVWGKEVWSTVNTTTFAFLETGHTFAHALILGIKARIASTIAQVY